MFSNTATWSGTTMPSSSRTPHKDHSSEDEDVSPVSVALQRSHGSSNTMTTTSMHNSNSNTNSTPPLALHHSNWGRLLSHSVPDNLVHLYRHSQPFSPEDYRGDSTSHSSTEESNPNSPQSNVPSDSTTKATPCFLDYAEDEHEHEDDDHDHHQQKQQQPPPIYELITTITKPAANKNQSTTMNRRKSMSTLTSTNSIPSMPLRHGLSERRRSRNASAGTALYNNNNNISSSSSQHYLGWSSEEEDHSDYDSDNFPLQSFNGRPKTVSRQSSGATQSKHQRGRRRSSTTTTNTNNSNNNKHSKRRASRQGSPTLQESSLRALTKNRMVFLGWMVLMGLVVASSISLYVCMNPYWTDAETVILLLRQPTTKQQQQQHQQINTAGKTSSSKVSSLRGGKMGRERYLQRPKLMNLEEALYQQQRTSNVWGVSSVILPSLEVPELTELRRQYDVYDRKLYQSHFATAAAATSKTATSTTRVSPPSTTSSTTTSHDQQYHQRTVILHESMKPTTGGGGSPTAVHVKKKLTLYPPDFTDNTQLYGILDSSDERIKTMERRQPLTEGDCVPMQEWQTTFHPTCNPVHELDLVGDRDTALNLFGTKGYWRNAWRVDMHTPEQLDTLVLKTLKIEHRFEEAHFEHDRIDAVAMERLTSSPHVINIFSFCGHSVMTEYADGNRLGELADKSKKIPLARLRIARDIASGLADVHGIDGDGNATFVHLDINPANVVSIGGTLKLNDFNIGIIRKWNTTSNQTCGFPAQYPNPQWRSPEEARNEQNLTEKVDVFSMGHIFFRLICGHEPWHKLEPGGKPSKQEMHDKVQNGVLPTIPNYVRKSQEPETVAIREAMLRCYEYDPMKRPSAREIAVALQKALDKLEAKK